jgi:hypothetical protein
VDLPDGGPPVITPDVLVRDVAGAADVAASVVHRSLGARCSPPLGPEHIISYDEMERRRILID